jgi:tetratricopeptide (TPR) repeat protein
MKKLGLTLGFCLVAAVSFGQKKAVADALKLAKDATKPNFTEARTKIKEALENAETKNDAKTWFTAGQIENLQFDAESKKEVLGQVPNYDVMFAALEQIFPYFLKTYELDQLPDAKGKVKPKFTKDMRAILRANMPQYINGGVYFFEKKKDFQKAYDFFDEYVIIADNPLMQEDEKEKEKEKQGEETPIDSSYLYANYYAAICAGELNNPEIAIKALERANKNDFKRYEVLQLLTEQYKNMSATENVEKTLAEGLALFPRDEYFLINLIGIYINTDRNKKALDYIQAAIQSDPNNPQYYDVAGRIYESGFKDYEKAEENYKKSIELDGENWEVLFNLGRVYFNSGVALLEEIDNISDAKKYNEEREKVNDLFRKALPFLEKALKLNSDANECKIALRSIYYNLNMEDKSAELDNL